MMSKKENNNEIMDKLNEIEDKIKDIIIQIDKLNKNQRASNFIFKGLTIGYALLAVAIFCLSIYSSSILAKDIELWIFLVLGFSILIFAIIVILYHQHKAKKVYKK